MPKPRSAAVPADVLAEVGAGGAGDAGLPVELLGDFLSELADAVVAGVPISARTLRAYRALGDRAAGQGVSLRALLDLYLSAAWRLWRHLPPVAQAAADPQGVVVAGEVMLHAVDDVVASLAEGYQLARRALVRAQESARREFVDDLLVGVSDVAGLIRRASGFGMDLFGPHAVASVATGRPVTDTDPLVPRLERAVLGGKGDAQALVTSKQGRLVIVFPAPDREAVTHVVDRLRATLGGGKRRVGAWQLAVGRPGVGADGVVSSYRDSLAALEIAGRLRVSREVVDAHDLLVYQVLLRDRPALVDLVEETLHPLRAARGGAQPLLDTLEAYFAAGGNAARCARALHLSVRAVTYRLGRVRELSGLDPNNADDRFTLHVAVLGARLLA
jgi:hypothetical protein